MPALAILVPKFPESVSEGTLSRWHKKPGEAVKAGEKVADIETDKIVIDVTAPASGTLAQHSKPEGTVVHSGFSTITWWGVRSVSSNTSWCVKLGVAITTASQAPEASRS